MVKAVPHGGLQPISRWLELDALEEAVSWPGVGVRPALVLAAGLIAAGRDADAYRCFHDLAATRPDEPLSLCGQLASELGAHGIRVLWLRSNGVAWDEDDPTERARSMLNQLAQPDDVGNVAAFLASERAATMTATAANITSGAEADS